MQLHGRGCGYHVIDLHREKFGEEYRLQTDGEHPDSRLR